MRRRRRFGEEQRVGKRVRAGLIGCGSVSQVGVLPQLAEPDARERIELVAVCDVVEERARGVARQYGIADAYADAQRMIDRDDIDLILVITPIAHHYPNALTALRAGKHVYVQKTMTETYAQAKQLVAEADARELTLTAAPGQMLAPAMRAMKALVERDGLGTVYWAWGSTPGWHHENERARLGDDIVRSADPSWYYSPSGGPLRDVTVYVLHSLTGIFGPARRVAAMSGIRMPERRWRDKTIPVEIDDNTLLLLDFGDARFALAGGHSGRAGDLVQWGAMGVYGTDGFVETLEIEPLSGHPTKLRIDARELPDGLVAAGDGVYAPADWLPGVSPAHAAIPEPHVYADLLHTVECIESGAPPVASGAHAAHVIEIIERGYEAARTGVTQPLESRF
jgi:predicted dehydrogenase